MWEAMWNTSTQWHGVSWEGEQKERMNFICQDRFDRFKGPIVLIVNN